MPQSFPKIKTSRWIIIGLVAFLFFTISRVPAEWAGWLLTRQPGMALSGLSGSLWKGQASVASVTVNNNVITLGKLQWDLQLLSLFTLSPCVKVTSSGQVQSFNGVVCAMRGGGLSLKDADATLPASLVQSKIPMPIAGNFSVHIAEMQLDGNVLYKLTGNLNWTDAQVNNDVQWISLGSFAAKFTDNDENGIRAKIFDLESEIDLTVDLELRAPNGGNAKGQLDVPKAMIDRYKLSDFLGFIGPQSANGNGKTHYEIQQEF